MKRGGKKRRVARATRSRERILPARIRRAGAREGDARARIAIKIAALGGRPHPTAGRARSAAWPRGPANGHAAGATWRSPRAIRGRAAPRGLAPPTVPRRTRGPHRGRCMDGCASLGWYLFSSRAPAGTPQAEEGAHRNVTVPSAAAARPRRRGEEEGGACARRPSSQVPCRSSRQRGEAGGEGGRRDAPPEWEARRPARVAQAVMPCSEASAPQQLRGRIPFPQALLQARSDSSSTQRRLEHRRISVVVGSGSGAGIGSSGAGEERELS